MKYKNVTQKSIQFMSDEDRFCEAIMLLTERAAGYEYKLVSDFVTAAEFYLGEVSGAERRQLINEIMKLFDECLSEVEGRD